MENRRIKTDVTTGKVILRTIASLCLLASLGFLFLQVQPYSNLSVERAPGEVVVKVHDTASLWDSNGANALRLRKKGSSLIPEAPTMPGMGDASMEALKVRVRRDIGVHIGGKATHKTIRMDN